ncbi:MAG: hypothetical protein ACREQ9_01770 [Candidatus Binatia bacterium]
MGSVVEFQCCTCTYSTGRLQVGWGKTGRAAFWGGLARCEPCGQLGVVDLAAARGAYREEPRCAQCKRPLTLIEGTSVNVPCPRCRGPLRHATVGTWT